MNTIAFERQPMKLMLSGNHLREKNQVKLFNKQIKDCKNKHECGSTNICSDSITECNSEKLTTSLAF
jgi:hypothetical protein